MQSLQVTTVLLSTTFSDLLVVQLVDFIEQEEQGCEVEADIHVCVRATEIFGGTQWAKGSDGHSRVHDTVHNEVI